MTALLPLFSSNGNTVPMPRGAPAVLLALLCLLSRTGSLHAMQAGSAAPASSAAPGPSRATVSGTVHDSIARRPLAAALVQLVASEGQGAFGRTVASDSAGRFTFTDVPDGAYLLGFHHALLDSLGVEAPVRRVSVTNGIAVRMDLAIPSIARLRTAICGPASGENTAAVVMGTVRRAKGREAAAGVTVAAQWLEISIGGGNLARRYPRRVATSRPSGWFAICHVPGPGTITLTANLGADSTDVLLMDVPASGFLRRDLYLGTATVTTTAATAISAIDSAAARSQPFTRMLVGSGRLSGRVVEASDGRPLVGAVVGLMNGPRTRTDAQGEWSISNAPTGSRTIEIRAVGHYPEQRVVDVLDGAPPLRVALATFQSVLDTLKVRATRTGPRNLEGFQQRRRAGVGRFLTPDDIARRQPIAASDILRLIPGLYLERSADGDDVLTMRGQFSERCVPAIYMDGREMRGMTSADIDLYMRPDAIAGIEVYVTGQVPPQFDPGMSDCGSIVIWTK
ncbi:MAG: carboxypeptidase regulatory-like domain-containing protein [Gemmatimonadota bacterium]